MTDSQTLGTHDGSCVIDLSVIHQPASTNTHTHAESGRWYIVDQCCYKSHHPSVNQLVVWCACAIGMAVKCGSTYRLGRNWHFFGSCVATIADTFLRSLFSHHHQMTVVLRQLGTKFDECDGRVRFFAVIRTVAHNWQPSPKPHRHHSNTTLFEKSCGVGPHHNFFQKVWCWCGVGVVWAKVVSCMPP